MFRLAYWAASAHSASDNRGYVGPVNFRISGNSPNTSAEGTKPSGPKVSFIASVANVGNTCLSNDG